MTDALLATSDGLVLRGRALPAVGEARGAVAMVHGLGEHSARYEGLHQVLTAAGFAVASADLRGFGRSPGPRGHINHWDDYRADTAAMLVLARTLAPGKPLFLFGHSMGGLIVLDYALQRQAGLAGVVASAPALLPGGPRRRALEVVASVLSIFMPKLSTRLGIDKTGISTLPDVVADYIADPLRTEAVSMRWGTEIMKVIPATREGATRFPLPLLVLHGEDDPITSPQGSRAFVAACGHPDHQLILYPGCRHEVHHDVGRAAFERDLIGWLIAHTPPTATTSDAAADLADDGRIQGT
jgi:alpha-beta hydrolase superfamily lysophospholipase